MTETTVRKLLKNDMFIDLGSNESYDFLDGLEVLSTGRTSVKSYHTGKFDEDLTIGTEVIAGWTIKKSKPAVITGIVHKYFDCGTTRHTFYKLRIIS